MSKEPTIACTMCDEQTDYYWYNFSNATHMICDSCFIDLSLFANIYLENPDDPEHDEATRRFSEMFHEWRTSGLEYQKATPQSMLERFFIGIMTEETE